jgi:hypothetical protein
VPWCLSGEELTDAALENAKELLKEQLKVMPKASLTGKVNCENSFSFLSLNH